MLSRFFRLFLYNYPLLPSSTQLSPSSSSFSLSVRPSVYPPACLSVDRNDDSNSKISNKSIYVELYNRSISVCASICSISMHPSVRSSSHSPTHLSSHSPTHSSVHPPICPFVGLLFTHRSIIHPSIYP